jgi:hypothetical protein
MNLPHLSPPLSLIFYQPLGLCFFLCAPVAGSSSTSGRGALTAISCPSRSPMARLPARRLLLFLPCAEPRPAPPVLLPARRNSPSSPWLPSSALPISSMSPPSSSSVFSLLLRFGAARSSHGALCLSGVSSLRVRNFLAGWRLVHAPLCRAVSLHASSSRAESNPMLTRSCFSLSCRVVITFCRELDSRCHRALCVLVFAVESLNPSSPAQPYPASSLQIQSRHRPARHQESQESGEDEASSAIFPKRSTNCLYQKIATDLMDSWQLLKR